MENLNDVEFGSEKSTEEAPILVAQRYLNIYRQVHIFNKAKRDQFDDELLALSPTITDFFKRMPGGRLLVEHIEEVKTERGIAFVKSSKEDFAEGSGTSSTPSVVPAVGGIVPSVVGGSVTVDASFAEALAKSMATAFNQTPMQANISGGSSLGSSTDLGKAFNVIAEEIKSSRASILDILKETKMLTDSVIASQVSISRNLEGILSSRAEGNVSTPLNIDRKLQDFKSEIRKEIEEAIANTLKNLSAQRIIATGNESDPVNFKTPVIETANDTDSFDTTEDDTSDYNTTSIVEDNPFKKKKKKKKKNKPSLQNENSTNNTVLASVSAPIVGGIIHNKLFKHEDEFNNIDLNEPPLEIDDTDLLDFSPDEAPTVRSLETLDGDLTIKDIEHETSEDIDDGLSFELPEQAYSTESISSTEIHDESSLSEELDDGLSFDLPEQGSALKYHDSVEDHSVIVNDEYSDIDLIKNFPEDDGLSFALPEKDINIEDLNIGDIDSEKDLSKAYEELDNLSTNNSISNDFAISDTSLENNFMEDFISTSTNEEKTQNISFDEDLDAISLDKIDSLEDLSFNDFESPNSNNIEDTNIVISNEDIEYSDNSSSDGFSFDETDINSQQNVELDNFFNDTPQSTENNNEELNNFFADISQNTKDNIEESATYNEENYSNDYSEDESDNSASLDAFLGLEEKNDNNSFDILSQDETPSSDTFNIELEENNTKTTQQPQSRYSAELDRIRSALTSENIDISSLDEPIALDDYSDDENIPLDDSSNESSQDWEWEYIDENTSQESTTTETSTPTISTSQDTDEEWEWEYVDENGNPIEGDQNSQDWEWEYVEEDEEENNQDNNQ